MNAYEIESFGIDNLKQTERDLPKPAENEVFVKVHSTSLNYRDVMVVEGTYNPKMRLPAIPFSDAACEVVEVGANATRWKVGDRVCSTLIPGWIDGSATADTAKTAIGAGRGDGVLREYATFHENAIVSAPEHLSYDEAATLPCAAVTAWNALVVSGNVRPAETVLTLGTGGVSIFAIQFAKALGARVISTSSSDDKLARVRELGADEMINYKKTPDWDKAVLELTGGVGVDHVVEVGGVGTLTRSIRCVRTGGHVALIGALDTGGEFNPIPVFMKAIRMQGIFVGSRSMFEAMNAKIAEIELKPVIDRTFLFDEVREALAYMKSGSHFGKIVVRVAG